MQYQPTNSISCMNCHPRTVPAGLPERVAEWSINDKIKKAIELAAPKFKPHLQQQINALLDPRVWWLMCFVAMLLATLAWFYAAIAATILPIACALLQAFGISQAICNVVPEVCNFLYFAATAKSKEDLLRAGDHFYAALAMGAVNAVPIACAGVVKAATRYAGSFSPALRQQVMAASTEADAALANASRASTTTAAIATQSLEGGLSRLQLRSRTTPFPRENVIDLIDAYDRGGRAGVRTLNVEQAFPGTPVKHLGAGSNGEAWLVGTGPHQIVVKQRIRPVADYAEKTVALGEEVRQAGFPVVKMTRVESHPDLVASEAALGQTFYDLSAEAQQAGRVSAEALAKQAKSKFPHLSIDYEVDNFLYSPDGRITAWIDPGPCF